MSRPMRSLLGILAAAILIAAGQAARADIVENKDGSKSEGQVLSPKCADCAGSGQLDCPTCRGTGAGSARGTACATCEGQKKIACGSCGGVGASGEKLRIRVRGGVAEVSRAQVRRIIWQPVELKTLMSPEEYYKEALSKLDPKDARATYELGAWCVTSGMDTEARKLLAAAVALEPALAEPARKHIEELSRRAEAAAMKSLLAALVSLEQKGPADGLAALRTFRKDHAETEIGRRVELQRDLIRRQFPKLAAGGADTIDELIRSAEDRLAARCDDCAGSGREPCQTCRGAANGPCPDCAGTGQTPCPVCTGTARLTCPKCFGTGRVKAITLGYGGERDCTTCNGLREVACDVCEGKGKRPCKRCTGTGRLAGACKTCAGTGTTACRKCAGTGLKPLTLFTWGPPPVRQPGIINIAGAANRVRAWQGEYSGGIITVVGAETVFRGGLSGPVDAATGKKLRLLAVALDNRKGTKLLRLRAEDKPLRGVTEDHAQADIVDLAKLLAPPKDKEDNAQLKAIAAQAADRDCLPGAYECAIVAMPEGTSLGALTAIFWVPGGQAEPARLSPIWLTEDEVAELRKSLR